MVPSAVAIHCWGYLKMFKRSCFLVASAAAVGLLVGATAVKAAETDDGGFQAGSILVRARALGVLPDTGTSLSGPGAFIGGHADVTDNWVPELDASYFFTPNIAVEAIAGVTYHDVTEKGNILGVPLNLGSVRLLPPTVTAQWHFLPTERFNPYVGAGINYTFFYDQHGGPSNLIYSTHYDDAVGAALQFGFDYNVTGRWYVNSDVKKLFLSTNVHLDTAAGAIKAKVDIDPWLLGFGIGYRF